MSVNSSLVSPVPLTFTAVMITRAVLLLPFFILILSLVHQQRRQQRSFKTISHSDSFTFHQAAMELISILGIGFYFCGIYADVLEMATVGFYLNTITYSGPSLLQILTCVESYLAVVHPITYLGLRQSGGVRIRNISTGCVWLACFGWIGVMALYSPKIPIIPFFSYLIFCLIVVSFCCLSVLCVLIRPRLGELGGKKERIDQSKQRAFHTIMVILGVLWLWFVGLLVCLALNNSPLLSDTEKYLMMTHAGWLCLPSSLVLPLLFLQRAGKLPFCSYNRE